MAKKKVQASEPVMGQYREEGSDIQVYNGQEWMTVAVTFDWYAQLMDLLSALPTEALTQLEQAARARDSQPAWAVAVTNMLNRPIIKEAKE